MNNWMKDAYKCNFQFLSINSMLLQEMSRKKILSEQELICLIEQGLSDIEALSDDGDDIPESKSEEGRVYL